MFSFPIFPWQKVHICKNNIFIVFTNKIMLYYCTFYIVNKRILIYTLKT